MRSHAFPQKRDRYTAVSSGMDSSENSSHQTSARMCSSSESVPLKSNTSAWKRRAVVTSPRANDEDT